MISISAEISIIDSIELAVIKNDIEAMNNMAIAANFAGKAINISKTTAAHAISYPITKYLNRYPDSKSINLKKAIQEKISKKNITEDNIIIGNGSNEILELVARKYLSQNSEVLFCKHSFLVYKIISNTMSAKIIESKPISTKDNSFMGVDLDSMKSKITSKTRVIFIANPGNPTGVALPIKDIEVFIKKISKIKIC